MCPMAPWSSLTAGAQGDGTFTPECGAVASMNGRSDAGFHAGELTRALQWLGARPVHPSQDPPAPLLVLPARLTP